MPETSLPFIDLINLLTSNPFFSAEEPESTIETETPLPFFTSSTSISLKKSFTIQL
ncbi:MAG: hypothetical protein ACKVLF_05165 [Nitrospinaceae bacterium]